MFGPPPFWICVEARRSCPPLIAPPKIHRHREHTPVLIHFLFLAHPRGAIDASRPSSEKKQTMSARTHTHPRKALAHAVYFFPRKCYTREKNHSGGRGKKGGGHGGRDRRGSGGGGGGGTDEREADARAFFSTRRIRGGGGEVAIPSGGRWVFVPARVLGRGSGQKIRGRSRERGERVSVFFDAGGEARAPI